MFSNIYYISDGVRLKRGTRFISCGTKYAVYANIIKLQKKWLGIWWNKWWLYEDSYNTEEKFINHFKWKLNRK